jgi:uncharacterized protein YndB with AHSA1/START domain
MEEKNEFIIVRTFNAPLDLVWKLFTESEHLTHWWGPKDFKMKVNKLELKPGGTFHYGLESPDGSMIWGKFIYREVIPQNKIVFIMSFSDEHGATAYTPFGGSWPLETLNTMTLSAKGNKTTVTITAIPHNATAEEQQAFIEEFKGMNEGYGGSFDKLDEYILTIEKSY